MILHKFIRYLLIPSLGYFLGVIIWFIVINPYRRYYDFTFGYYWPHLVFCLGITALFALSLTARCTITLFLPSMVGGATQNFIIILLFTALLTNPLTSIGLNSVESVRVIGCSLTLTFDQLSERAKLVLNPILQILSNKDQTHLDPIREDLLQIQQFIGQIRENANLVRAVTSIPTGDITKHGTSSATSTTTQSPTTQGIGIQLEWDLENFGLKAKVDMQKLRGLAKSGKLQKYLGKQLSGDLNLTDVLYNSCLNMFEAAKRECSSSVDSIYENCKESIGAFSASIWCRPFTYSFESFCPWIMQQLVDEETLCKQVKILNVASPLNEFELMGNQTFDVNEAFRSLNARIDRLNQQILIDDSLPVERQRASRFEIHLTFNEQTRRVFKSTKAVIDFISDKYKMRRLFIEALSLAYDAYTTYTFILIMAQAWRYRRSYLADIKFDNFYITDHFIELDRASKSAVLPLDEEESKRFITTFTCRRRTYEERQAQRLSLTIAGVFMAFTLSLFYLDDIFYSLLVSIQDHSLIRYKELGHHELDVRVKGDGTIGRLVKQLVGHLNSVYSLDRYTSTRQCLPEAQRTRTTFYFEFIGLVLLYFVIDQISIYAMRLRRTTCAFFHPDKEHERVVFLRKLIQYRRRKILELNFQRSSI